jgi:hypothetical protein
MIDLGRPDFGTSGTFKAIQRGDEFHFDLGFQDNKKKSAIYKNGTLAIEVRLLGPPSKLPKHECARILNMVVTRVRLSECSDGSILSGFAMASQYFRKLEEMPVFPTQNFYNVCAAICSTKSYVAKQARSVLCGYSAALCALCNTPLVLSPYHPAD